MPRVRYIELRHSPCNLAFINPMFKIKVFANFQQRIIGSYFRHNIYGAPNERDWFGSMRAAITKQRKNEGDDSLHMNG